MRCLSSRYFEVVLNLNKVGDFLSSILILLCLCLGHGGNRTGIKASIWVRYIKGRAARGGGGDFVWAFIVGGLSYWGG